ncbi:MAG: 5'-nucleotidase C-terminal domain-containing protein, partial [Candidatus Fermentibacteraceae bacterium]|nr:5'-nucleotidase C-terminal domain-containing protein [Candidatus Fermentibacteraceae bacterium]
LTAYRNQAMPDGEKIEDMLIGGEPFDPDRIYRFVTTGYLAIGNIGYDIMLEHESVPAGVTLMDAVTGYISLLGEITPDNQTRIIWIEEPR